MNEDEPIQHVDATKPLPDFIVEHLGQYAKDPISAHLWDASFVGGSTKQPVALLTTVGRKTGQLRTLPMIYARLGENYLIVASNGGAPHNPAWYLNLIASDMRAHFQVAERKFEVKATVLEGPERKLAWQKLCAAYTPLPEYPARTERVLPVIRLDVTSEI
jgi:deazaflavin-dependent oxidoreductase (nitroreductase family)